MQHSKKVYELFRVRYLATSCEHIFLTSRHYDLTSRHKKLTSLHKDLTSRHNNLTSDDRNMPPYIPNNYGGILLPSVVR